MFRADEKLYLVLFVLVVLGLSGLAAWYEIFYDTSDTWPETIKAIGQGIGSAVAVAIALIAILELAMLISERYRAKRYAEGRAEGLEEGRAEGLEEGKATGKEQERMRWHDWNSRRTAAEARGEKFEEPPPSISGFSSQHWLSGVANRDDLRQYATVLASMRPIAGWRKL